MRETARPRTAQAAGAALLAALAAGCAGSAPPFPLPDEPGLYALSADDELIRLDGDQEWQEETWEERSSLGPTTEFVIYEPSLEQDPRPRDQMATLWRVAWVRSEIDSRGLAGPITGSEWALAPIEPLRVLTSAASPAGYEAYVHVVAVQPLAPGLYALRLENRSGDSAGRLGVDWEAVDRRAYASRHCVDRIMGSEAGYRLCTAAGAVVADNGTAGLEITQVEQSQRGDVLVVEGVVVNTTAEAKPVPLLLAVLRDSAGRSLSQAVIRPREADLQPGARMSFRSEIPRAPQSTARVDIDFMSPAGPGG